VTVLQPKYRNCIFATQKLRHLMLQVTTLLDEGEREHYTFDFTLTGNGRTYLRHRAKVAEHSILISLPWRRLPTGEYQMLGRLVHKSGKMLAQWRDVFARPCTLQKRDAL